MVDEPEVSRNGVYFLRYGASPRLDVGVGYWAEDGKVRPAVNYQLVGQTKRRPALLTGYGSEPLSRWKDDGAYLSLVKGFGPAPRRLQCFAAYFREVDGGTDHLIGGVSQALGRKWLLFAGKYLYNTWDASLSYQITPEVQLGLWACNFTRSTEIGVSLGTGWSLRGK
jgi:hypothetical protein